SGLLRQLRKVMICHDSERTSTPCNMNRHFMSISFRIYSAIAAVVKFLYAHSSPYALCVTLFSVKPVSKIAVWKITNVNLQVWTADYRKENSLMGCFDFIYADNGENILA